MSRGVATRGTRSVAIPLHLFLLRNYHSLQFPFPTDLSRPMPSLDMSLITRTLHERKLISTRMIP